MSLSLTGHNAARRLPRLFTVALLSAAACSTPPPRDTLPHPTSPLPSYAKVTNVATGRSIVVRVNDRGPFHPGRVIDLSYAAAYRLGIAQRGSGEVEVESIVPDKPFQTALVAPLPPIAATD